MNKYKDFLNKEIKRLKKYETEYYKIVNSSSYKWIKLFEKEFIKGNFKKKIIFLLRALYIAIKYFLIKPVKVFLNSKILIKNKSKEKLNFKNINTACILDTFSYYMFKNEFNLIHITPDNWKKVFTKNKVDFFFMEFIWSGYKNSWLGFRNQIHNADNDLYKILTYCKDNAIPTIIWNKEDPMYFNDAIELAKHFDIVYTLEDSLVDRYKEILGHNRVYTLSYAINPKIHNPINKKPLPDNEIVFPGSYYTNHLERMIDYDIILKPCLRYNFDIFSRYKQRSTTIINRFPEEYQSQIKGSVDYPKIIDKYKEYKLLVNVNAVRSYAFSRRVVESIASGTPVISSYNEGLEQKIGSDIVMLSRTKQDTINHIDKLLQNDFERDRLMMKGIRRVYDKHTSTHRAIEILDKLPLEQSYTKPLKQPLISIILSTHRTKYIDRIFENFRRQKYQNIEMILAINSHNIDKTLFEDGIRNDEQIRIIQLQEGTSLGDCLNTALVMANGSIIAKFDDDDLYSPHFITDQYNALLYTDAMLIGKTHHFCYIESKDATILYNMSNITGENNYTDKRVAGGSMVWRRELNRYVMFRSKTQGEDTAFIKDVLLKKFKIYSTNRYGYLRWRSKDLAEHTWKMTDKETYDNGVFMFNGLNLDKIFI